MRTRLMRAGQAAGVALALTAAATARADVTVERFVKTGGLAGLGASEGTTTQRLSGLRQRETSSLKLTGAGAKFLGKMAGDMGSDSVTLIEKDVVWRFDHKRKTYTESRITPPPSSGGREESQQRGEKKEKSTTRVVRSEVTVRETGEKKNISGFDCAGWQVVWLLETEDTETKERSKSTMTMDLWNTPENSATKALQEEERKWTEAYLRKIGWDLSAQEAQKLGMSALAGMVGDDETVRKGAKEAAEKMSKIKGYSIATAVKWQVETSGGKGGGSSKKSQEDVPPDVAKGLGGLMAAMGQRGGAQGGKSGEASGPQTVFDSYTEIRKIDTSSVPASEFAVPAGYTLSK